MSSYRSAFDPAPAPAADDDPRLAVLVRADLMAAPIGTVIGDGDTSWHDYARKLLADLDAADTSRRIQVPTIPFPGGSTQADFWREAAIRVERGYPVGGSNLTAAVAALLRNVADAVEPQLTPEQMAEFIELGAEHGTLAERRRQGAP